MSDDRDLGKELAKDPIGSRVQRIRFRMAREHTRFMDEVRLIPSRAVWTVVVLYLIAQAIAQAVVAFKEMPWPEYSHQFNAWAVGGVVTAAGIPVACLIFLVSYVHVDAKRREMNAGMWTILVIILMPAWLGIGFIIYFLLREPLPYACPNCRETVSARFNYCPSCKFNLRPSCPDCRREVRLEDRYCPHCAADLTVIRPVAETSVPASQS